MRNGALPLCAALCSLGLSALANAQATYTTFDPPGSINTFANCISDTDPITGAGFTSRAQHPTKGIDCFGRKTRGDAT